MQIAIRSSPLLSPGQGNRRTIPVSRGVGDGTRTDVAKRPATSTDDLI